MEEEEEAVRFRGRMTAVQEVDNGPKEPLYRPEQEELMEGQVEVEVEGGLLVFKEEEEEDEELGGKPEEEGAGKRRRGCVMMVVQV